MLKVKRHKLETNDILLRPIVVEHVLYVISDLMYPTIVPLYFTMDQLTISLDNKRISKISIKKISIVQDL